MDSAAAQHVPDSAQKQHISPDDEKKVLIKELLLQIPVLLLAGLTLWSLRASVAVDALPGTNEVASFLLPLFLLSGLLATYGFVALVTEKWWPPAITGLMTVVLGVVLLGVSPGMIVVAVLLLAVWVAGGKYIARERDESMKIRIYRSLKRALPILSTILLLMPTVRFHNVSAQQYEESDLILPRGVVVSLLGPLEGGLRQVLPGFSLDANFQEFAAQAAADQISKQLDGMTGPVPADLTDLQQFALDAGYDAETAEQLALALEQEEVKQAISQDLAGGADIELANSLSDSLGIEIATSDTVTDVITKYVNTQLTQVAGPFAEYVPWLFSLIYWFGFRLIAIPFIWLAFLLAWGLFKILQHTPLFDVVYVKRPVEEVSLITS
ncbi:MAG: hypothetical protein KC925_01215 [Candidatus Doudnabacteria bacterium]|nr:hypothetical protein [Candidatus Doudnabacteria bacterium]